MSSVSSIGTSGNDVTSSLKAQTLSQGDFLKLMTSQLQNQDPLKPLDNSEFVSQMAQFSTVSGIQSLQDSFSTLAGSLSSGQALQASALVGHNVLVPASSVALGVSGPVSLAADVPASGDVVVDVTDASGQVVRRMDLGAQPAGLARFQWDGIDSSGARAAAGSYSFTARVVNGTQTQTADTLVSGKVDSVSLDSGGALTLNIEGAGAVAFSKIRQIS